MPYQHSDYTDGSALEAHPDPSIRRCSGSVSRRPGVYKTGQYLTILVELGIHAGDPTKIVYDNVLVISEIES